MLGAGASAATYLSPACQEASAELVEAHAQTEAARRQGDADVGALYLDEAQMLRERSERCGPARRLVDAWRDVLTGGGALP